MLQQQGFAAFGGGASGSTVYPAAAALLALVSVLILFGPRKLLLLPVLLGIFLVPEGNVLVVAGLHITPERLIALLGFLRLAYMKLSRHVEILGSRWNSIDTVFLCWALCHALAFVLLWRESAALINQLGFLWTSLGIYFLLRALIQDGEDIERAIRLFALIVIVNCAEMLFEHHTGHNLFGMLGGAQFVEVREGTIRAQGAFSHSILAGTYAATLVPLLLWLWKCQRGKVAAGLGLVSATLIVLITGSSTPLLGYVGVVVAFCFWPLRGRMRVVRWGIVLTLVGAQLMMKAPVWFLINHVNVIGASSGYHRAELIDQSVQHFGEWWLMGTKNTAAWGWDMYDLANQFVGQAATGGLATLIFFILVIKRGFSSLGTARRAIEGDSRQEWMLWCLGAALFTYILVFFGISLWDQSEVAWFALFAFIGAATSSEVIGQHAGEGMPSPDSAAAVNARLGFA